MAPPALTAKGAHYQSSLGAALVRGAWGEAMPGATPNGSGLSWSELIRKWSKHTGGNVPLVQSLRNVSLLDLNSAHHVRADPGSSASSGDGRSHETASGSTSSYVHIPNGSGTAPNGASHSRSASVSTPHTFKAEPPNTDGEDGASGNAWVRGANWGRSLDGLYAEEVREGARALEGLLASSSALAPNERLSAALTLAYHHHALADHDGALLIYEQFNWSANPTIGVVDGDAAVVERVRARTFQGISLELAHQPDIERALQCYLAAVALLDRLTLNPITTPPYLLPPNARVSPSPGVDIQRELLRHVSTALTRAAVLAARIPDADLTLRVLRTYHAISGSWNSTFRANQRQRMMGLYVAALQSSYPARGLPSPEQYLLIGGAPSRSARETWRAEVVYAMRTGQRMLADTTAFPRAGDINTAVTNFTDQIAVLPDMSPSLAGDTIEILWWGTTLTFQSQSILRHLVRLLSSGDATEARRAFELYVEIVLKTRQTHDPESPLKLQRRPTESEDDPQPEATDVVIPEGERPVDVAIDSDEDFAATLLIGAEHLLTAFNDSEDAWRYATLAGEVVKYSNGISPKLAAKVEECRGIVRLAMSTSVAGPAKRPVYQTQAINHLRTATTIDPRSSEAFYHLSYAHAIAREIGPAVEAVRSALELDSESVRAWHLLALLLTAQGDWHAASRAGETGVALWDNNDEAVTADEGDTANATGPIMLLTPSGDLSPLPVATTRRQSRSARLETVIQLRMTLNVIAEKLHGPELALERHQQLFSFFSQRTEAREREPEPNPPADLGDSYVLTRPTDAQVSPIVPAPSININSAAGTLPASPTESAAPSESDGERRVRISQRRLFPKHLHVPSVGHHRTASGHQAKTSDLRSRSASSPASMHRSRTVSTSTLAPSIAPTAVHSHYRGAAGALPPPPPLVRKASRRTPAEERILSDLWLMSAASFRRAGKHGQALVAIEEAETHDPENPNVWVQLGLLQLAEYGSEGGTDATKALTKALLLVPDYPPAVVCMAKLYLSQGDVDLAHSLLWQLTEDRGWDVPTAWLSLATACERQGRSQKARECLQTALKLETTKCCRVLGDALKQW